MISQTAKERPQSASVAWLGRVSLTDTFLSSITFAELRRGIERLPEGRKRRELEVWLRTDVAVEYGERIFAVDAVVANLAGSVKAERVGLNLDLTDSLIAATARVHGLSVATLNRKHFERLGVQLVKF